MNRYVVGMRIPIARDFLTSQSKKPTFRGVFGRGLVIGEGEIGSTRKRCFKGQEDEGQ